MINDNLLKKLKNVTLKKLLLLLVKKSSHKCSHKYESDSESSEKRILSNISILANGYANYIFYYIELLDSQYIYIE